MVRGVASRSLLGTFGGWVVVEVGLLREAKGSSPSWEGREGAKERRQGRIGAAGYSTLTRSVDVWTAAGRGHEMGEGAERWGSAELEGVRRCFPFARLWGAGRFHHPPFPFTEHTADPPLYLLLPPAPLPSSSLPSSNRATPAQAWSPTTSSPEKIKSFSFATRP